MNPRRFPAAALAVAASLAWPAALAQDVDHEPVRMVRSLQILQDQIAHGSETALRAQSILLPHIAQRFLAAPAELWADPKNARAALIYVLSGGHPDTLRALESNSHVPGLDPKLVSGVLAYSLGQDEKARELLADFDIHTLHPSIAGQVALVRGVLLTSEDPARAIELLDLARLLMPGTLVEESALRREIAALGASGNLDKLERLAIQYMRRFQDSGYAAGFREEFAELFTRLGKAGSSERLAKLDQMLLELKPENRQTLYLSIAFKALVRGQLETARYAAEKASLTTAAGSAEAARAALYAGAALLGTEDFAGGLERLEGIRAQKFPPPDESIKQAALRLAGEISKWPAAASPPADAAPDNQQLLDRAGKALSDADALLAELSG